MEGYYKTPSSCHVITFLSTTILLLFIQPSLASTTTAPQSAYNSFIKTSCANTTYPSLCSKTLLPYAPTVQTNPVKLCDAALSATLNSARATSALVSTLARQKGITSKDAAVIKDCISNIGDSVDELKQSVKAMDGLGRSPDERFQVDNIKTWLSAAITDENTCTDGFSGLKVSADVKSQIRKAISKFTKLTSNALSLVNHLNY